MTAIIEVLVTLAQHLAHILSAANFR